MSNALICWALGLFPYQELKLLDHMTDLCLTSLDTFILFSTWTELVYISTNNVQGFLFLHTLTFTFCFWFFFLLWAIPMNILWFDLWNIPILRKLLINLNKHISYVTAITIKSKHPKSLQTLAPKTHLQLWSAFSHSKILLPLLTIYVSKFT